MYYHGLGNKIQRISPRSLGCDLPQHFAVVSGLFPILYSAPTEFCPVPRPTVSLQHEHDSNRLGRCIYICIIVNDDNILIRSHEIYRFTSTITTIIHFIIIIIIILNVQYDKNIVFHG